MKYIDADRLREKLIDRVELFKELSSETINPIRIDECSKIIDIIDSLQQEQPEVDSDLDADIEMEWDSFNKNLAEYGGESEEVVWLNRYNFNEIARYFYELGLKARKV